MSRPEDPRDTFIIASDSVLDGWKVAAFKHCDGETGYLVTAGNCMDASGIRRFVAGLEAALDLSTRLEATA